MNLLGLGVLLLIVGLVLWLLTTAVGVGHFLAIAGVILILIGALFDVGGGMRWRGRP